MNASNQDFNGLGRRLAKMRRCQAGDVATIYAAIERLNGLPLLPSYVNGLRDELMFLVTGKGQLLQYPASTYLCFYGEGDRANYFKIGIAKDVKSRLATHATSNPLTSLWSFAAGFHAREDALQVEAALLRHMEGDKARGEWVRCGSVTEAVAGEIAASLAEVASAVLGRQVVFDRVGQ